MDDLISRQVAIENSFEVYTKEYGWCEVVGVDAIRELPSAQPEHLDDEEAETIRIIVHATIETLCNQHRWDEAEEIEKALKKVIQICSAQPGWIPVTERLPNKDGDYLVTTHSGQIARYIFIGGSSEEYWRRCATAWMPLPIPYQEGGQDDE